MGAVRHLITAVVLVLAAAATVPDRQSLEHYFEARRKDDTIDGLHNRQSYKKRIRVAYDKWLGQDDEVITFVAHPVCSVAGTVSLNPRTWIGAFGIWFQVFPFSPVPFSVRIQNPGFQLERFLSEWAGTPMYDIYGLVVINVIVYLFWALERARYGLPPWKSTFMRRHFTVSAKNLLAGRIYTLATCAVSNEDFAHLFHNMLWLLAIGPELQVTLGRSALVLVYVIGGMNGGICSMCLHQPGAEGMGASGSIYALEAFNTALHPSRVYIWFGKDVTALQLLTARFALNATALVSGSYIDFVAQFGGAASGWVYYEYMSRFAMLGVRVDFSDSSWISTLLSSGGGK